MRQRLDLALVARRLTTTRSQAESYVKLGLVSVDDKIVLQPARMVDTFNKLSINIEQQYVSRAALKLASVANKLDINFDNKVVLDVGSSTGGFTDFSLKHGASKVIAVDVGSDQLHPSLRNNSKIELHEQTDIRNFNTSIGIDIVVIDVSFISMRAILPKVYELSNADTQIIAMLKPQFEVGTEAKHKGVIKNDKIRRKILSDFEYWLKQNNFIILNQSDSEIMGTKGNKERFYLLKKENLAKR